MALMLRTLQMPTRVVNGFQPETTTVSGKTLWCARAMPIAGSKVYFPEYAGFPFDPTPADPSPVPTGRP